MVFATGSAIKESLMDPVALIGPSIHITGEVTAQEPLAIAGTLDGSIQMSGHALTVTPDGRVNATVAADTVVIGGRVNGRIQAGARIVVRETATIEGELSAPVISLADGARVSGRVETAAKHGAGLKLAS
jgi:cytoskeletal protein CcmA (bactofilin family)